MSLEQKKPKKRAVLTAVNPDEAEEFVAFPSSDEPELSATELISTNSLHPLDRAEFAALIYCEDLNIPDDPVNRTLHQAWERQREATNVEVVFDDDEDDDDDYDVCAVCLKSEGTNKNNQLICCHTGKKFKCCGKWHHQLCIGLFSLPPENDDWVCQVCANCEETVQEFGATVGSIGRTVSEKCGDEANTKLATLSNFKSKSFVAMDKKESHSSPSTASPSDNAQSSPESPSRPLPELTTNDEAADEAAEETADEDVGVFMDYSESEEPHLKRRKFSHSSDGEVEENTFSPVKPGAFLLEASKWLLLILKELSLFFHFPSGTITPSSKRNRENEK